MIGTNDSDLTGDITNEKPLNALRGLLNHMKWDLLNHFWQYAAKATEGRLENGFIQG